MNSHDSDELNTTEEEDILVISRDRTETIVPANTNSKSQNLEFDDQVNDIRRRSEIVIEKLLALPVNSKTDSIKKSESKSYKRQSKDSSIQQQTPNDSPSMTNSPKRINSPVKKNKTSRKKSPEYLIPKRQPIVLPDPTERYEQQLMLLQQQQQRIELENNRYKAMIRDYQIKLRDATISAETLRTQLEKSQNQTLQFNKILYSKKKQ